MIIFILNLILIFLIQASTACSYNILFTPKIKSKGHVFKLLFLPYAIWYSSQNNSSCKDSE